MRISRQGPAVRVVKDYVWARPGDSVEIGDSELVVALLLQPGESFEVADDEPLLEIDGIDKDVAGQLALEGIGGAADLAGLSARPAGKLAKALGRDRETVKGWVVEAKELVAG